ncbi:MAG: FUSC family protein [Rhodospirillales bacterium]|nr:FUSC family protein [Rhodospirillales bacterium]
MGIQRLSGADFAFALRVTVASVVALFVAQLLSLPMPLWSVLTAAIVSQLSIGGTLKTGANYMLGTLGGSIYGGAIAVLVPHASETALLAVLVIAVAPLALYSATHANMNVVPISAIIVLLMPAFSRVDPLHSAIDRILEVAVGAAIGLLVALVVAPSTAHRQMRAAAARLLDQMAETMGTLAQGILNGMTIDDVTRLQDRIGTAMVALDAVGGEAERERLVRLASGEQTGPLRRTLLRLRHDLVFLGRAIGAPFGEQMHERLRPLLEDVVAGTSAWLRAAAVALRTGAEPPPVERLQRTLATWTAGIEALRRDGSIRQLSADVAERFFAASFALEQMHRDLQDLERIVTEWREPRGKAEG